jgi:hypothetical protein
MGQRQNVLAFVRRNGNFVRVKGQGLLKQNDLSERFRRRTIGSGAPARMHHKIQFLVVQAVIDQGGNYCEPSNQIVGKVSSNFSFSERISFLTKRYDN